MSLFNYNPYRLKSYSLHVTIIGNCGICMNKPCDVTTESTDIEQSTQHIRNNKPTTKGDQQLTELVFSTTEDEYAVITSSNVMTTTETNLQTSTIKSTPPYTSTSELPKLTTPREKGESAKSNVVYSAYDSVLVASFTAIAAGASLVSLAIAVIHALHKWMGVHEKAKIGNTKS